MNRLLIILLFSWFFSDIYDYTDIPDEYDTFEMADFRIYIPRDIDTLRGIYTYMHPFGGDSRNIVQDIDMINLCTDSHFGLMGVHLDNMHMDSGIGESLLNAQFNFAEQSGHEELVHAPIYFEGFSWGGQWAYHFTKWFPNHVLGFITMKGGYHDTTYAGDAIKVPGYMFIGENDADYRIDNLTNIFLQHRPMGALWALTMEQDAGHSQITERELLDNYFYDIISKRLPDVFDIHEEIQLIDIEEENGWVGDRHFYDISSYHCFDSELDTAAWLPSQDAAIKWQNFVSEGTIDNIIACMLGDVNYDNHLNITDIVLVVQMILDIIVHDYNADMNLDDGLNILDILMLINQIQ